MRVDCINKSVVPNTVVNEFLGGVQSRMSSIDFAPFGLADWTMHIVVEADQNTVSLASPLSDTKKFIHFQGIPSEINYNSSFEAKIVNIRLRLQNMIIPFEDDISNIIFIIDFSSNSYKGDANPIYKLDEHPNIKSGAQNSISDSIHGLFKKKNDKEDEDAARLAKFVPMHPKHSLESVVMTDSMKSDIEEALSIIRNRKKIYEDWGFAEVDSQPKAVLNFWGPPGTGKTKCAQGIAMAMGQKILCVNYAEIESKYAGESPKNLIAAFHVAQDNNAVLFFDEADSFLGKRIGNVQTGHDQSINSLRSQMLIQLEDFEGIVIFATNLVKNFDSAFETRILRHIKFDMPDLNGRIALFKMLIPKKAPLRSPLTASDYERLAITSDGFSGRDIRNSILDSLSAIANDGTDILDITVLLSSISKRQDSYAKLKEEKSQENKKIVEDIKNGIEANAKKEFNEALVAIALYAAMSDDVMPAEEEQLLMEYASALNVELPVGLKLEYFPPITNVIPFFNTKEKKLRAIDLVLRVIAIDGEFADGEKNFIEKVCDLMEFSQTQKDSFVKYGKQLSVLNRSWKNIISC